MLSNLIDVNPLLSNGSSYRDWVHVEASVQQSQSTTIPLIVLCPLFVVYSDVIRSPE